MRIVGGELRGRRLASPARGASQLRPTSDRLRETIFNILGHGLMKTALQDTRVLDLFAGTGALGIEAISRGVKFCLFVENEAKSRGLIRQNVDTLAIGGVTRLFRRDATKLGPSGAAGRFSLVFADPPYGRGLAEKALISAHDNNWLEPGALIVVEERRDIAFDPPTGFREIDRRQQGESAIIFLEKEN